MAFTKYIVPALAFATVAFAQSSTSSASSSSTSSSSSSCPSTDSSGIYTIQNQGDADQLQDCSKLDGSVTIAANTAGNIAINGIQEITGNLTCYNSTGLTAITSDQLTTIGQYFHLEEITVLSNLQMNSLSSVNVINFVGLPNLQSLNFDTGVQEATGVRIVNTQLNSLAGIELSSVSAFEVTNNDYLSEINVNNLASVSSYLTLSANAADLEIEFPNLLTAANMTFRNISSLAIDSLANVTGALGCYSNTFKSFSAPNLTLVGNALVFDDNSDLTNISIPMLTNVGGGYQIANNTDLKIIDGFTKLQTVGGALDFSGAFTNVSLPALKDVKGGFNMQSTSTLDCSTFDSDHTSKIIKGTYVCEGTLAKAGTAGSTPTSTSSGSSSSSSSKSGAVSQAEMNMAAVGIFGAVAALFMI